MGFISIFIANEFFDALPIKQFIKKKNFWYEKFVCSKNNKLHFSFQLKKDIHMKISTTGFIVFGVILLLLVVFGVSFFEAIWSFPTFSPIPLMVIALVGTGIFVTFWLGFPQIKHLKHGIKVTSGKYDNPNDTGQISHFSSLNISLICNYRSW